MYYINHAQTGIDDLDKGLDGYFRYLAGTNVLPEGNYALAGGSLRCLLDKTSPKDLDIYILGDQGEHQRILFDILKTLPSKIGFRIIKLAHPFSEIQLLDISIEQANQVGCARFSKAEEDDPDNAFYGELNILENEMTKLPIQLISLCYDSNYSSRVASAVSKLERFSDTFCISDFRFEWK